MNELMEFIIPNGVNCDLVSPEEYTYWKSRQNRTFYIDYELNENFDAVELAKAIVQLNIEDKEIPEEELKPIYIWIFSPGGDTYQCDMLCDILEASRIPIVTINMGLAMSSAFFIFLAGKRRYCFEKSMFMVHSGYLSLSGRTDEVDSAHKNYKKELDRAKEYVLKHTTIDEKTYKKNQNKDWYMDAKEAVQYGVATLVSSFSEIV